VRVLMGVFLLVGLLFIYFASLVLTNVVCWVHKRNYVTPDFVFFHVQMSSDKGSK
jgi:hypothetical protein